MYRTPPPKALTIRRRQYRKHPAYRNRRRNRQRQRTLAQRPLRRMLRRLRFPRRSPVSVPALAPEPVAFDLLAALDSGAVLLPISRQKSATLTYLLESDVPTVC